MLARENCGVSNLLPDLQLAPDAPTGLGRMMAGDSGKTKRRWYDFYPTPPEATRALLRVEGQCIATMSKGRPVWEPCGRGGAIIREIEAAGLPWVGTDVVSDVDNGVTGLDLLAAKAPRSKVVVTNPPFALAAEMIVHLLDRLKVDYLALLLKATFFHADERRELFRLHPPARIHALTWRLDFKGQGAPVMECAWFVWQRSWALGTHYDLLSRADERFQGSLL